GRGLRDRTELRVEHCRPDARGPGDAVNALLGTVSAVDAGARRVQVTLPHLRVLTGFLRCVSPFGLVAPLPAVGDEVLIVSSGAGLADAVCVGWLPTASQVLDAADHP